MKKKNFESRDLSATAPVLKRMLTEPVLAMVPKSVSPNALTIFGGLAASLTAFLLWTAPDYVNPETIAGKSALVTGALALVVYAICDQLDGLQARRCKKGGPTGDFLDHWVDALLANVIPAGLMIFLGIGFYQTVIMLIVVALAFWANNWQTLNEKERELPFLGGLEFIWVGVASLGASAVWGMDLWDIPVLGFDIRTFSYLAVIITLLFSILKNVRRAPDRIKDFMTPLASLGGIALWLVLAYYTGQLNDGARYLGFFIIGLMAVKHTGDLMRQLWLGVNAPRIDRVLTLPGILLLLVFLYETAMGYSSGLTLPILWLTTVLCLWLLCWQAVNTFTLLSIQPKSDTYASGAIPDKKRIMVDMSATLLHHGHIRLLAQAHALGHVVVGLTSDQDLQSVKNLTAELTFDQRKEILMAIEFVDEVVETPWLLTNEVLQQHNIDMLVHGDDNQNDISDDKLVIFPRTEGISSEALRASAALNMDRESQPAE